MSKAKESLHGGRTHGREPFVTSDDVAAYLSKPVSWIYGAATKLGIPRHKVGLQWRYRLSEVDAWVARGSVPA